MVDGLLRGHEPVAVDVAHDLLGVPGQVARDDLGHPPRQGGATFRWRNGESRGATVTEVEPEERFVFEWDDEGELELTLAGEEWDDRLAALRRHLERRG